jgi:tetratricopeptide (TPR) repeat protein
MESTGTNANILKRKLAVAGVRKDEEPLKFAHAVRHLGDAYCYAKQFADAEPCYVEALSIYRNNEDTKPLDLANAIRGFAVLKGETGASEEAKDLWREAHDLYLALKVTAGVAGSAARLALLTQSDPKRSREWLREAIAAAETSNDPETLQYIREVRAQIEN